MPSKDKAEHVKLELRPEKDGRPLELSARKQRLIQLQHPDAARVVVKKLHAGFSSSLVLQTLAYDEAGRPNEPAVTKLEKAQDLAKEVEKQDSVSSELGPYAIRVLRRPLYLGTSGDALAEYMLKGEHETDADGAVVLELAGACWVLPEFFGTVADEKMLLVTFKEHLMEALTTGVDRKNCEGVFDDLYAVGGPVQRLASKPTFAVAATDAKEGFVVTNLEIICCDLATIMVPGQDTGQGRDKSAYTVPASLLTAATGSGPLAPSRDNYVSKRGATSSRDDYVFAHYFAHSFVHECEEQVWGDAACAPLIALAKELRATVDGLGSSWLASWRPLQLMQHGDLNAANVLLDVRGQIWLIDFAYTGTNDAFFDTAKLISELLFVYLPSSDEVTLRRGCAVVDALIPADGERQLWEPPSPLSERESTPAHALALSLAAKVQHAACDLVMSASRHADGPVGVAAADVHQAALWLPLLRRTLKCLRYRDLNVWQKRTAWHAVQRLSTALLAALPREPVQPPDLRASQVTSLQLAEGQLLRLTAKAAQRESASSKDVYEFTQDGLYRFLDRLLTERKVVVRCKTVALDDMLHNVGALLPDTDRLDDIRRRQAELAVKREGRAMAKLEATITGALEKEKARLFEEEIIMSETDQEHFKSEMFKRELVHKTKLMDKILLEDEIWAAAELRRTGVIEQRRYAPGQQLSVLDGDCWHDLTVLSVQDDGKHEMSRADEASDNLCLDLHAFNHAPLELHEAAFKTQLDKHAHRMSVMHASIRDALSGRPLSSLEQCVPIGIAKSSDDDSALAAIRDVDTLCRWLHEAHARRQSGERGASAAVLLTAPPAAGKTCLVSQLVMHTLKSQTQPLVPIVIKVMDLQRVMLTAEHSAVFASKWNWADAYFCATLGEASPSYRFLRQALLARRALLMLDGMDEGGKAKARIERHVQEVLLPQGHPMLLTSRPDSLVPDVYEGCARLRLLPLTAEQQREVIVARLNGPAVRELVEYVLSLPPDTDGNLLSGNPLMLNMLISMYESLGGMPSSLQKVYEMASGVMLGRLDLKVRGGSATTDAEQLRWLLREVALEVHLQQQRQISAEALFRVAKRLGAAEQRVAETVVEQLALDRMPMLSVIEREPLVVQFSHLSFQEYFAAQAICAVETKRKGLEPWRWPPWWGNAVWLGAECGEPFGLGLMRGAGLEGSKTLNLSAKLEKGSMAAIAAVMELIKASSVTSLNLTWNQLGVKGARIIAAALRLSLSLTDLNVDGHPLPIANLKGTDPVESIDLSDKQLGVASGMIIASCIEGNDALKSLNLKTNKFNDEVKHALQAASGGGVKLDL